jgi:hypothetical protein
MCDKMTKSMKSQQKVNGLVKFSRKKYLGLRWGGEGVHVGEGGGDEEGVHVGRGEGDGEGVHVGRGEGDGERCM